MELNDVQLEIIEFARPMDNSQNLFLTNIAASFTESEVQSKLHEMFSMYGLLYEVQVMMSQQEVATDMGGGYYAFVKFYSATAAANAKKDLTGRLFLHGQHIKIRYGSRKAPLADCAPSLYVSKCYDLANHYLGFDGWTTHILAIRPDDCAADKGSTTVRYVCVIKLELPKHGLHSEALGLGEQQWTPDDPNSKGLALCKAKKQAHRRAVENAFRRVIIVSLPDGRVHVEVNTTTEESINYDDDLKKEDMIKVTELEEDPDAVDDNKEETDPDEVNMQLLQELEEEAG